VAPVWAWAEGLFNRVLKMAKVPGFVGKVPGFVERVE